MRLDVEIPDELIEQIAARVAQKLLAKQGGSREVVGPLDVGVSRRTWRAAIKKGELQAVKVGRELLAKPKDVETWMASLRRDAGPKAHEAIPNVSADELSELLNSGRLRALPGGRK